MGLTGSGLERVLQLLWKTVTVARAFVFVNWSVFDASKFCKLKCGRVKETRKVTPCRPISWASDDERVNQMQEQMIRYLLISLRTYVLRHGGSQP